MTEAAGATPRRPLRRMAAYLPGLAVGVLLAELSLRLAGIGDPMQAHGHREAEQRRFGDLGAGAYEPGSRLVYTYPDNPRGYFDASNQVVGHINALGYRGAARGRERTAAAPRVAVLGDSFTLGYGVRDEDTLPARLEEALARATPGTEVLNFGVSAFGTSTEVRYLREYVLAFRPDVVLICLFLNDTGRSGTRAFLAPGRGGWWALRRHSYLINTLISQVARRRAGQEMIDHYRNGFKPDNPAWLEVQRELVSGRELCATHGCELVLVIYPVLFDLDDYPFVQVHETIAAFAAEAELPAIDLLPAFAGRQAEELWNHPVDQHPNDTAQRQAGQWLAGRLQALRPDLWPATPATAEAAGS